ncbi:MAG: DUF6468 domain-containing protein [Acetobacteraceae bacterium]
MGGAEWLLEIVLVLLLAITLFHASRLERALGVLKRDRASLQELVSGFNASTRQAEAGIDRLHAAADGAGRQVARQIEAARLVQADLSFLIERGERLADRMDTLVRVGRPVAAEAMREHEASETPRLRSQAERDLLKALRLAK